MHIAKCSPFIFNNEITEKLMRTSVHIGRAVSWQVSALGQGGDLYLEVLLNLSPLEPLCGLRRQICF